MRLTRFPHFISLPLQHTTVIASSFHHLVKIGDGCQIGPSCHFYTPVSTPPSPFSFDALIFLFLKECLVNVFILLTSAWVGGLLRATRWILKNAGRTSNGRPRSRSVSLVPSGTSTLL
jgi:hypothetical protein